MRAEIHRRETMTVKTKESERLLLEMTEGKKENDGGSFVGFTGAV